MQLNTPVVFLIFNRPELSQQVFDSIRLAKPSTLLVIADGPRPERSGELEKCLKTRNIINQVDWECSVYRNYSEINLGCKKRVSSGLNWAFELVEEAIILEDDCLPHETFFRFCEELLAQYRYDTRIMAIAGNNVLASQHFPDTQYFSTKSYYFSRYNHVWGWATWKRAWQHYDVEMAEWPYVKQHKFLHHLFKTKRAALFWEKCFQEAFENQIDSWAYAWTFACWVQNGLSIIPANNLVSNLGFGPEATHTTDSNNALARLPTAAIDFPLCHPSTLIRDGRLDQLVEARIFSMSRLSRAWKKLLYLLTT